MQATWEISACMVYPEPFAYHFIVLTIDSFPDCPIRAISQLFNNLVPVTE